MRGAVARAGVRLFPFALKEIFNILFEMGLKNIKNFFHGEGDQARTERAQQRAPVPLASLYQGWAESIFKKLLKITLTQTHRMLHLRKR